MAYNTSQSCYNFQSAVFKMEVFQGHPSTHRCLTGLRKQPEKKQSDKLLEVLAPSVICL